MTKKTLTTILRVTLMVVFLCFLLVGCSCKHQWKDATCDAPKTCSACQETEGEALGHNWEDATCVKAKTCSACQATEGEALGHTWVESTCQAPKTCSVCQATEGEVGDHKWIDATTETPKTCSVCQATEGERIITDSRFKTAANKELFGTWSGVVKMDCEELIGAGFTTKAEMDYAITFNPDGSYVETTALVNKEPFLEKVEAYLVETLYAEFSKEGLNQAQANEAMQNQYGMSVEAYAEKSMGTINWENLFATELKGVYYVSGNSLYSGGSWTDQLESDEFSISNNRLKIQSIQETFPELEMMREQVNV